MEGSGVEQSRLGERERLCVCMGTKDNRERVTE